MSTIIKKIKISVFKRGNNSFLQCHSNFEYNFLILVSYKYEILTFCKGLK